MASKMYNWEVTGNITGEGNKTVKVKAFDKVAAIEKGLKKLNTRRFVSCRLIG